MALVNGFCLIGPTPNSAKASIGRPVPSLSHQKAVRKGGEVLFKFSYLELWFIMFINVHKHQYESLSNTIIQCFISITFQIYGLNFLQIPVMEQNKFPAAV